MDNVTPLLSIPPHHDSPPELPSAFQRLSPSREEPVGKVSTRADVVDCGEEDSTGQCSELGRRTEVGATSLVSDLLFQLLEERPHTFYHDPGLRIQLRRATYRSWMRKHN
ncbi:hypothetical protein Aduo_018590 [Ancylostoma duodenale]